MAVRHYVYSGCVESGIILTIGVSSGDEVGEKNLYDRDHLLYGK